MSKAARERSARERLAVERKRQAARDKQRRLLTIVLGAVVALAVVVVAVVIIMDQRDKGLQHATAHKGQLPPVSREADGSVVLAKAGVTKPLLEVFEDFQCPICKQMEDTSGKTIEQLATEGRVKVVYRPFHLFGGQKDPVKTNSLRSAAAALCVPADKWVSYHDALFEFQPDEGQKGFAPKDLVRWGKEVGVTDPGFDGCVTDMQKKPQVDTMTDYALKTRKVEGTPTVFLDGKQLDLQSQIMVPEALASAITAASGK